MILYYAVLYRQSNPRSQTGKPFEGKGIFCIFVATTSSAPWAAACPETNCCLLADKLAVGCKSDVLDASAGRLYLPWAACLPRPCFTGKGESFPRVVCIYPGSPRPTIHTVLQHSRGGSAIDRGMAKFCHFFMSLCFKWCSYWGRLYSQIKEGAERCQQSRKNPA